MSLVNENLHENDKKLHYGLEQLGLTCKSICVTCKIWKLNLVYIWAFFKSKMVSKDGCQPNGLSKMDLLLQIPAWFWWSLGHLICFPASGLNENTLENIISLCSDDISITYYFSPVLQWRSWWKSSLKLFHWFFGQFSRFSKVTVAFWLHYKVKIMVILWFTGVFATNKCSKLS